MKKIFILLLMLPVMGFGQRSGNNGVGLLLNMIIWSGAAAAHHHKPITFPGEWHGTAVYDSTTVSATFTVKNGMLAGDTLNVALRDKKLTSIDIQNEMGAFKLRRLTTFDNYLHRELFALNGVTVYDHNIYKTDAKDVQPDELVFLYDGKYYKVNNNLFKKREKNIRATLAEIPIADADREAITQQCMLLIKS